MLNTGAGPSELNQVDGAPLEDVIRGRDRRPGVRPIIVTTPSPIFARLTPGLSDSYRHKSPHSNTKQP